MTRQPSLFMEIGVFVSDVRASSELVTLSSTFSLLLVGKRWIQSCVNWCKSIRDKDNNGNDSQNSGFLGDQKSSWTSGLRLLPSGPLGAGFEPVRPALYRPLRLWHSDRVIDGRAIG